MAKVAEIWLLGAESLQENLNVNVHLAKLPQDIKHPVTAIVIATPLDNNWLAAVKSLRAQSGFAYTPLFFQGNVPLIYRTLFDGPVDENLLNNTNAIAQRLKLINADNLRSADFEMKILNYLFSRPNLEVVGRLTHTAPHVCEYPLVEVLAGVDSLFNARKLLQECASRDLLESNARPKKFYSCGACDGGLLNIQQVCPKCHTEDYKKETLVHCFCCGKIGPVPEFLRRSRLICSYCHAHLKSEGVDHEMPKEDKHCSNCDYYFSEAETKILCLVCDHVCRIKDLEQQSLNVYRISRRGEYLIRGIEKNMYKHFNLNFKVIDYVEFSRILNWQMQLAQRYKSVYFSIMNIRFDYEIEYASTKELATLEALMSKLFSSLRVVLRESDLSTRLDSNLFFLLPMTDSDGGAKLIKRIQSIISSNKLDDALPELRLQLNNLSSENILNATDKDSENILMELQKQTKSQQHFYLKE